jgi:hypothetical protein
MLLPRNVSHFRDTVIPAGVLPKIWPGDPSSDTVADQPAARVRFVMDLIASICDLPKAATLKYVIAKGAKPRSGFFEVTTERGVDLTPGAVYFLVDDLGRLQKIGKTDEAKGLGGRLNAYKVRSGGKDATPNLYYRMMSGRGRLKGRSFTVHFLSLELKRTAKVLGSKVRILYTAHGFIESYLRERVRELRRDKTDTYPLWLEKGMYPSRTKKPKRTRSKANRT